MSEHYVQHDGYRWAVFSQGPKWLCEADSEEDAQRIAAALNAQLPVRVTEYGSREHADKLSAEIAELSETLEKAKDAYAQGVAAGRSEALNQQAGVVEALRELEDAQLMPHELERARIGEEHIVRLLVASENARAALAAVKG